MFKKILILSLFFFVSNNLFSQNYNWITPNKTYLKMYVYDDGMYRINKADFTSAGIVAAIDPRTVKVYNKGVQIPIYFNGESDGIFDPADYFDFYGKRNYGGLTKTYETNNTLSYITDEYYDSYSDTNVYWVDWGGANGLRMSISGYSVLTPYSNSYFYDMLHFEKDYFYSQGEALNNQDQRFLNTDKFRGEGWYWVQLNNNQTLSDTFSLPYLYTVPQTATLKFFAYPTNRSTSIFNEHVMQVKVNGNLIATIATNDMNRMDTTISFSSSLLSNVSVNTVSLQYTPASGYTGSMYVDFMELKYPRMFKFNSPKLAANLGGADTTSQLFSVSGYNSANPINIYDVANNIKINTSSSVLDTLKFTGKGNANFVLSNENITKKPFRIKQKQVPDFVSASNGADYLIVYHNLFTAQAEQLRAYRASHDNFRSVKAEIEDIYDVFNYGIENPVAVRNFTNYIYSNWQQPKLGYICLFGRASLDPKKNTSSSVYYQNFVPTYGYPPSDGYFANVNIGTFCYYDMIAVGRIPVYYPSEAQNVVDKIISYENNPPSRWWKNYMFITGGGTASEQQTHQNKSEFEINTYVIPPTLSGDPHRIYRSDLSGSTTFNIKDSIINDLNRGCAFVNFRGHAGSHDWELAMNDPNTLNNGSRLPIILSLTCFTGENSKPDFRGFGERFIYLPDKGAIGYVGTTGWSYTNDGNDFGTHILQTMKGDTTRRLGLLTKYANKKMSQDSLSFSVRHTLNCYSLMGDPALTLNIPVRPEFSITNSDYKLSNTFPNIGENITLSIYPKNYGLFADSCKIRMQLKKDGVNYLYIDTIRRNFALDDTVNYNITIDSLGIYSAVITLDYGNWYPLENKNNNSITVNIPIKNTSFIPLNPVNNSLVYQDSVEFVGLNPRINTNNNSVKVILQLDTSKLFGSPVLQTFVNSNISGVTTKFKTRVPFNTVNKIYFWRTNSVINNDSSGWSSTQNFIFNNILKSPRADIKADDINKTDMNSGSNTMLYKVNSNQYSPTDYTNTAFTSNGIELSEYSANLFVRSYGSNGDESSYFTVGNKSIFIDGFGVNAGLNMLKVKKLDGDIVQFKNLKMNTSTSSDSLVTFLNTFDSTYYLMLLNAAYFQSNFYLSNPAKIKLRQFGSIYCDSIGLISYFHTWSFIGYLGATSAQASEMFDPCCRPAPGCYACDHWTQSTSSKNVLFKNTSGKVSSIVGPAQSWTEFSWTQTLKPNSTIKFDVYGIDVNSQQTLLMSNLQTYQTNDLSSINAYQYPKLNIVAKIDIDTTVGTQSSILNSLKVNYTAPSELTWNISSLEVRSSYRYNEELKYSFNYYNPGKFNLPGVIVNTYLKSMSAPNLIITDTLTSNLYVDSLRSYASKFTIPFFRDSLKVYVQLKPLGQYNEFYSYNNYADFSLSAAHLNIPVKLQVYSDGQLLNNGDYVNMQPELKVKFSGSQIKTSLMEDTSQLSVKLNGSYIPYYTDGKFNSLFKIPDNDNITQENELSLLYFPKLSKGTNKLIIIYKNESDNTDSVSYDVSVSDELAIKDFYNYPNPMKSETNFIFNLAGSDIPNKFKIRIYTIAGKLIKQIEYPINIGFNSIPWDGKDDDGDYVANGTYLYKLVTEDNSKTVTQIQKLVVLK